MAEVAGEAQPVVPEANAAPAAGQQQNRRQQQQQGGGIWSSISRALIIYFIISNVMKYIVPQQPVSSNLPATSSGDAARSLRTPEQAKIHYNHWKTGEDMELWLYLTDSESFWVDEKNQTKTDRLFLRQVFQYSADFEEYQENKTVSTNMFPLFFRNESNVYAHAFLTRYSATPKDGIGKNVGNPDVTFHTKALGVYFWESKSKLKKNLLGGGEVEENSTAVATTTTPKEDRERKLLLHWVPDLEIRIVDDHTAYPNGAIPPHMLADMKFDRNNNYYPTIVFHDFWVLKEKTVIVNETLSELPLRITIGPMTMMWWQLFGAVNQNFNTHEQMGMMDEFGKDEIKRILTEGNPILLAVTMVVSLLHTVFDMLAFKNDINFWRKVDSLEGLSVRTIFLNVFCQAIVFLYLIDNETSMMILFSSGVGLAIEIWKIKKACHVTIDRSGFFPKLSIKDKSTYVSKTRSYDKIAMRYLAFVLYPMMFGYSIYSVYYDTHKSWYSFVLSTLVGCVYTFGFIMMTPQLFINYKLKSVAHLPWKAMMYKFLNTIIDDLFAFIITMPLMHRLSCFRDDLIFLIYIYQRWIYRVDMSRVNEYGQVGDREAFEKRMELENPGNSLAVEDNSNLEKQD